MYICVYHAYMYISIYICKVHNTCRWCYGISIYIHMCVAELFHLTYLHRTEPHIYTATYMLSLCGFTKTCIYICMCTSYVCMCYPQTDINSIQSTDYGEILSSITDITILLCLLLSWLDELKVYITICMYICLYSRLLQQV